MRTAIVAILAIFLFVPSVAAQEPVWLQIEAKPTLREAQERARAYASVFPNVNGFRMTSGWYAIALGPYRQDTAPVRLGQFLGERLVPEDAYIADGSNYRQQFWPIGAAATPAAPPAPAVQTPAVARSEETVADARRSERALSRRERQEIQEALKWRGFYGSAIDGAFGPGTRRAMEDYQLAMGYPPTGVLTSRQRQELVASYREDIAALGLRTVEDAAAGIRITMPTRLVRFARYEPPFVHYDSADDGGVRVILISQKGDRNTLFGLYDVMQTLEIVPIEGDRSRGRNSFVLTGKDSQVQSYTYAAVADGMVKGFTLVWQPKDEDLMKRVAELMRASFEPFGDVALDESLGDPGAEQAIDLFSGLEIRKPEVERTGFFVDGNGAVLTTADAVRQCTRITVGQEDQDAEVVARDDGLGLAILRPRQSLAPIAFAKFQAGTPRLRSEIAVAGFSYGGLLDMPVMTYGELADLRSLSGDDRISRLALEALPGDSGGPVFDNSGAVVGMLLGRPDGKRKLPQDVNFAASVPALAEFLSSNGIAVAASDKGRQLAPEDLSALAADMTVLVSCWN